LRRRTAAALLAAAALIALIAFAATGFGAGASGPAKVERRGAISVHVHFAHAATKAAHHHPPRTLYGSAAATVPLHDHTVSLGRCPLHTHIVNGTVAALNADQARYLTIHGFGVATPKTWFVDVGNHSDVGDQGQTQPGFPIKAAAFIVCERD
jgi:hypothetical protein